MSLDVDNMIYRETDPRSKNNRISFTRGADRVKMWHPRLLQLARQQWPSFTVMVLLGMLITLSYIIQGLFLAYLLKKILIEQQSSGVYLLLFGILFIVLLRAILVIAKEVVGAKIGAVIAANLRRELLDKLVSLGPGWVTGTRQGALQSAFTTSVEALQKYFQEFLASAVVALLGSFLIIIYLAHIDIIIALFVGICALVSANGHALMWRMLGTRIRFWWVEAPQLAGEFMEVLRGMPTFKIYGVIEKRRLKIAKRTRGMRSISMDVLKTEILGGTPGVVFLFTGVLLTSIISAIRYSYGHIDGYGLLIVLILSRECFRPIQDLRSAVHSSYQGVAGAERVFDIMDAEFLVKLCNDKKGAKPLCEDAPFIEFSDVSFKYSNSKGYALKNINFKVFKGQTVAIIGSSGSGKSTMASLLMRFMEPSKGQIKIAGLSAEDLTIESYRDSFAYVGQTPFLFHGTIRENLLIAKPDATEKELWDACEKAYAAEFIKNLQSGLDTQVGERGARFSGGQRQRISIARAFLKDAPILLLDEATSSIDIRSEQKVQSALNNITSTKTCIIIAHRLSTIREADCTVVLEKGEIVEVFQK